MKKRNNSQKKIADEILLHIGKSVLLVFVIVAIVAIFMVRSIIVSSKKTELTLESDSAANQLAGFFNQYAKAAEQLAVNPEIQYVLTETTPGDKINETEKMDTVRQYLKNATDIDSENIMSAWIADLDTSVLTQSDGFTSEEGWDITSRTWYPCIEAKTVLLTDPYIDSSTGDMILSAVAPIFSSTGEALGATGLDISINHVMEVMSQYKIGNNGYIFLLSGGGDFIYHPKEDMIQKNIADINISKNVAEAVAEKKHQFLRYTADGVVKYGVVAEAGDTGYIVVSNLPMTEYYSFLIVVVIILIIIFIVGIFMIVLNIKRSAAALTKPILELNDTAQHLAAGDLDVHMHVTAQNEIGELGESISKTVNRLKEYIVYIDETSEVLGKIADGKLRIDLKNDYVGEFQKIKTALLNISSSMSDVMDNINHSASQVSSGASDLAEAAQTLAEGAETQAAAVEELVATSATIKEQIEESSQDAKLSAEATEHVTTMMEKNQQNMKLLMDAVNKIHETSQEVVGIIQTIEEIAEQTNLLSLNASIEAARAGEAGKGFAVVADEIGKLALESSKAASMTRNLIEVSMEQIDKGNNIAKDVTASLEQSVNAVDHVNDMVKKTSHNTVMQSQNMEQIRLGIEDIAQGVQDNSAAAEETSATSQELASQATLLKEMIQRFEMD